MAKPILSDELWTIIEPLIPVHTPSPKGGRPRLDNRAALTGILFVLRTGLPWEYLPQELGVWFWHELLAKASRLATGRTLATVA